MRFFLNYLIVLWKRIFTKPQVQVLANVGDVITCPGCNESLYVVVHKINEGDPVNPRDVIVFHTGGSPTKIGPCPRCKFADGFLIVPRKGKS